MVIGFTGSFVQTWFFMAALYFMSYPAQGSALYYVAFGIGFVCEMIPNYFFSNWYTFGTRPSLKNAGVAHYAGSVGELERRRDQLARYLHCRMY